MNDQAQVRQPNLALYQVFDLSSEAIFILEYAQKGDLQIVLELEGRLEESKAIKITKQVLEAVAFLHDNKVVHLDIKPKNILLVNKWSSTQIKLCDFGLSCILTNQYLLDMSGTTDFLAPEVVNYEPVTCATDMWNIGVLIYVPVSGHTSLGGTNKLDTQNNMKNIVLHLNNKKTMEQDSSNKLDVVSMVIWLSTGNGKFFELHGSREIIKQVLPKSSDTAFRWGYYNSPADPDRQSYTQVLEAFLQAGFHIEGSSGAGTQGLLRTQYVLVKRSS
ncbi:unnamed protein product [Rotaria magnacalcarata]|uniref:Protein kinase domain-containing protein n=3 Tax=Rotaria magnacalcarata TaxID=392030 RepID=A0A814VPT2_9BILA|nr:unnamed protein product [Rotaria magnacalcarata]CAF3742417.1 unnamed protein product [Rotaria magnacalcarata]CAF3794126.1 unnamed protein product [Rotaria magnacalcarata]